MKQLQLLYQIISQVNSSTIVIALLYFVLIFSGNKLTDSLSEL